MITDNIINEEAWSFASDTVILPPEEVQDFLRNKKVIK